MALILEAVADNGSKQQTKIQELDFIENGFWYDETGKERLRVIRYGMKRVRFRVYFTNLAFQYLTQYKLGMSIDGKYYSSSEKEFKIAQKNNHNYVDHILSINGHIFANTIEPIVRLSCVLTLKSGKRTVLPYNPSDYCKVHFVIFVPQIMKHKGWSMSFKFQEYWFYGKANDNCEKQAFRDAVTIEQVLSYARVKKTYEKLHEVYKTENAQKMLIKQIQKMISNKELILPQKKGESVSFGNFSTFVFDDIDGSQKEKIHQYQYQYLTYDANIVTDPLDDFYGAFGKSQFYLAASGYISKLEKGYKIQVNKIAVYLKDNFDFQETNETFKTNVLGIWNYESMDLTRNPIKKLVNSNITIWNKDYRNYRDDTAYGCDFNVYSTYAIHNLSFDIIINNL